MWIQAAERVAVTEVAQRLGLTLMKANSIGPCPSCATKERGSKDKRGAIGIRTDNKGWACHRCGAKGSGIDLVSYVIGGSKFVDLPKEGKDKVAQWFDGEIRAGAVTSNEPQKLRGERPPINQVTHLWRHCLQLHQLQKNDECIQFLKTRNLNLSALAKSGVVRFTPARSQYKWPEWWPAGRSNLWRVVVPAFDETGKFVSLHGRAIRSPESAPKTLWPKGYEAKGLFMPNRFAVKMLKGMAVDLDGVLFVEGLTDFLKCSAEVEDLKINLAVLGGASGSFDTVSKISIPSNVKVYIGTDPDEQGREYAQKISSHLKGRSTFRIPLEEYVGGEDA